MSALSRVIQIIEENPAQIAAAMILDEQGPMAGYFEQRAANDTVRRLREDRRCPTCGADT